MYGVTVAVLHVVWKMRLGEPKIPGSSIPTVSICLTETLTIIYSSLLKRDPRNTNSSVARMLVVVPVAVLHVVLKRRFGEAKILGDGIVYPSTCSKI